MTSGELREFVKPFNLKSGKQIKQVLLMKSEVIIKKCFVSLIVPIMLSSAGFCVDYTSSKLNEIEKNYYGYTLNGTVDTRLSKLEKALYGTTSNKPQKVRVEKIYKDLNLGLNTGAAAPVQTAGGSQNAPLGDIGPKAEAGIKYPVVDELEKKVFKKTYSNEDIYVRLSRLEKQTFKKESTLSLNERVDALRDKLLGGGQSAANIDIDPSTEEIVLDNGKKYYGPNDYRDTWADDNQMSDDTHYNYYSYENTKNHIPEVQSRFEDDDTTSYAPSYEQNYDLDVLEKQLFGKRFTTEPPQQRLARLENKVFQRTFNDNQDARTQRLLAVTTAQKTSKEYDSNKWAQRINTGIQIGSILLMVLAIIL